MRLCRCPILICGMVLAKLQQALGFPPDNGENLQEARDLVPERVN